MTESANQPIEELSFGQSLKELEGIVGQLEGGQLELEDSLARYERGVGLVRSLQEKLSSAEQKVTTLLGEIEPENNPEAEDL